MEGTLNYFEFNDSVIRVFTDKANRIWYGKDEIVKMLFNSSEEIPNLSNNNQIKVFIDLLNSVPNLSENPDSLASELFIDTNGLFLFLAESNCSDSFKFSIVDWIDKDVLGNKDGTLKSKFLSFIAKNSSIESDTYTISDKGISKDSIPLLNADLKKYQFYSRLESRLDQLSDVSSNDVKIGIKIVLDCIENCNLELVSLNGIKLEGLSGKDLELYLFSKKLKKMIRAFLKDNQSM